MLKTGKAYLAQRTTDCGLFLTTYSPGDGVTRYRFHTKDVGHFTEQGIYTALGLQAGHTFIDGYELGRF